MRYIIAAIFSVLSISTAHAQRAGGKSESTPKQTYVEKMPSPPFDVSTYLSKNVVYPDKAKQDNVEGKVVVKFVVDENGMVGDVSVTQSLSKECDEEAMRVIRNMPPWTPGAQSGKPVKVYFTLPIVFKLDEPIYTYVEEMPEFAGDISVYLQNNLVYPREAIRKGIEGRVTMKFIINEDGSTSNVSVVHGISPECDDEAVRVVKNMKSWKPGRNNGKAVRVYFTLPIVFKLTGK